MPRYAAVSARVRATTQAAFTARRRISRTEIKHDDESQNVERSWGGGLRATNREEPRIGDIFRQFHVARKQSRARSSVWI